MVALLRLLLGTLGRLFRSRSELMLENLALRQQLEMYERPPRAVTSDRLFWTAMVRFWPRWRSVLLVVRPETVVRWHRAGFRHYWRWRGRRGGGRPPIPLEARELIAQIARENPRWGAVRIQAELRVLGYEVSAETVRRYRLRALRRPPSERWQTFLRNHRPELWTADFFTVQTLTFRTLYVFFFISHQRRRIEHINVTAHPTAVWVWRQVIEATPWGRRPRFLIRDRDRSYGGNFIARARALGMKTVLTPIRAPEANGIAERVIGSMRRECFDHIIPINERHLRRVLREYVPHYNEVRPHRTLELEPPDGPRPTERSGQVVSVPVQGGLHHRYARAAA